jgi:hypothetical protein
MQLAFHLDTNPAVAKYAASELIWGVGCAVMEGAGHDIGRVSDFFDLLKAEAGFTESGHMLWTPRLDAPQRKRLFKCYTRRFERVGWVNPEEVIDDLRAAVWVGFHSFSQEDGPEDWLSAIEGECERAVQRTERYAPGSGSNQSSS